jgi:PAS domain S-box-containing protein
VSISADITEQQRAAAALRESASVLRAIIDNSPALITTSALQGRYLLVNEKAASLMGVAAGQSSDKLDDILPKELAERHKISDQQVVATGKPLEWEESFPIGDELHHFVTTKFPLRDLEDRIYAICTISIDMTAFKRAETENKELQEEIIRVQGETLRALSTPLMPISAGVIVMPLIGTLERARMEQVLEALLNGVVAHRASCAIVDVTGVPVVNAEVASALIRAAQAVRLVGAKVVLTGIQPVIARTLVELGADLSGIVTKGTLESGIAYALGR